MKRFFGTTFAVVAAYASPLSIKSNADPATATASDQQIAPNRFVVLIRGGPDATADQLREQALLRAAQLTQEKGGEWFEIVPPSTRTRATAIASVGYSGLGYTVTTACEAAGCLSRATPVMTDAGQVQLLEQAIEIMIGSGEALEGGRARAYLAREVIAKTAIKVD